MSSTKALYLGILCFLVTFNASAQLVNISKSKEVVVFSSYSGTPNVFYRIPSLVTLDNQKILFAFAEQRIGNQNTDSGNINIVYKLSANHGKSWSRQYLVCSYKGTNKKEGTCGNPTVTVDQDSGYIHVFMNANNGNKKQFGAAMADDVYQRGDRRILYMRGQYSTSSKKILWHKSKNGQTQMDLTTTLQSNFQENFDLVGPGVGIFYDNPKSTRNNRLIVPASSRNFYSDNTSTKYIDDIDWVETAIFGSKRSSETAIVQLPNNILYRNDRMHGQYKSGLYCGSNDPAKKCRTRRMVSLVKNVGTQLQNPTHDVRLLDPPAQGSLLRYTKSNILFSNCDSQNRRNLTIKHSNGIINGSSATKLHFNTKSVRVDSDCGYSSLAKTRDYRIGVLYEKIASDKELNKLKVISHDGQKKGLAPKDLVFKKFPLSLFK